MSIEVVGHCGKQERQADAIEVFWRRRGRFKTCPYNFIKRGRGVCDRKRIAKKGRGSLPACVMNGNVRNLTIVILAGNAESPARSLDRAGGGDGGRTASSRCRGSRHRGERTGGADGELVDAGAAGRINILAGKIDGNGVRPVSGAER